MNDSNYIVSSKAIIYQGELDYISKCVLDYPDIETGGDLFGFWTYSGYPVIQYVIGPGAKANHQVAFFNQDVDYLVNIGNMLRAKHGLQHIGEWHSHHKLGLAHPSGHDVTTVTTAIEHYLLKSFFLVIANVSGSASGINGFMFSKNRGRDFDYTGWVVLESNSPIRESFDKEHADMVHIPQTTEASITGLKTTRLEQAQICKPEYTAEYWLAEKGNQLILKQIVDELGKKLQHIKVFQKADSKAVYLQLEHKNNAYYLFFPVDFPTRRPVITSTVGEDDIDISSPTARWNLDVGILKATTSFTYQSLGIKNKSRLARFIKK